MAKKTVTDKSSIFDYDSSLQYIKDFVLAQGHGFKSKISQATGCQSAYVSRVLGEKAFFSLEQAERLVPLFLLSEAEAHYFLTLVQRDRASTPELKAYFDKLLDGQRSARLNLKQRVRVERELSPADRQTYYSSWIYGAVHVMTSIPTLQTPASLAQALHLPATRVLEVLEFLVQIQLIRQERGRYVINSGSLHLGQESPLITQHHLNWRMRALQSVEVNDPNDLHYSIIMSLSQKDVAKIKANVVDMIEEMNKILGPSKEEEAQVLCIDLFKIK